MTPIVMGCDRKSIPANKNDSRRNYLHAAAGRRSINDETGNWEQ